MPLQGTQSVIHSTRNSSPYNTDYESDERESLHSAPRLRATSEPPPDLDDHTRPLPDSEFIYEHHDTSSSSKTKANFGMKLPPLSASSSDVQQYSWEWGAFPTPSPIKTTFAKGGRLDAIPWKSKMKNFDELFQREVAGEDTVLSDRGKLSAKEEDDSIFVVTIQQQSFDFQLSLVPQLWSGMKEKGKQKSFVLPSFDDNASFAKGRVTFSRFMQDEHLADNANLVIKWSDGKYMTQQDHPVLFSALVMWRTNCLLSRIRHIEENISLNGSSHHRSISEPPTPEQRARAEAHLAKIEGESEQGHPTSPWVQWWNRSRQKDTKFNRGVSVRERPALKPAVSAPSTIDVVSCHSLDFG